MLTQNTKIDYKSSVSPLRMMTWNKKVDKIKKSGQFFGIFEFRSFPEYKLNLLGCDPLTFGRVLGHFELVWILTNLLQGINPNWFSYMLVHLLICNSITLSHNFVVWLMSFILNFFPVNGYYNTFFSSRWLAGHVVLLILLNKSVSQVTLVIPLLLSVLHVFLSHLIILL